MTQPRIAIVLPDLRFGGGQRVLLGLARRFVEYGLQVDVVTLFDDGDLHGELPLNASRYALLSKGVRPGLLQVMKLFLRLVSYLRRTRPDGVLSTMTGTNLLTAMAHRVAGGRGRLLLREAASFVNLRSSFFPVLMRVLYRQAQALVAVSSGVADDLASLGFARNKIHVIHNPIDVQRVRTMARESSTVKEALDAPYILSIGRLVAQKDHETLLRAYAASQARNVYRLVIVGDGELKCQLMAIAEQLDIDDRVNWLGAIRNPYGILGGASLLVLSSRWEGYPNVLLEAMALGVPVVSTDCPDGPREILAEGRFGRLAEVGDCSSMSSAMDAELERPSLRPEHLCTTHDLDSVARHYLALMGISTVEDAS